MIAKVRITWRLMFAALIITGVWLGAGRIGHLDEELSKSWVVGGLLLLLAVAFGVNAQFKVGKTLVRCHPSRLAAAVVLLTILAWIGAVSALGLFWSIWLKPEWTVGGALLIVVTGTLLRFRAERPAYE